MTPAEFRTEQKHYGLSGREFALLAGTADARSVRRWRSGEASVPGPVVQLLRALKMMPKAMRLRAVAELIGREDFI